MTTTNTRPPKPNSVLRKVLLWIGGLIAFVAAIILILGLLDWNMLRGPV
jgi:uncharacterized protein involved in outer membrane biogenesis